ncbi:hypothetical protein LTR37_011092 [Vermiconidia calcicola]|uniref:Uncharacterized protein n=1 Tax=Vermiconidia calcicola TaxID=1690605 RepID=A0ACC3N353_9PEZI|nr:hypothetical protein LTR37_011092 [Vermiconidia calcicola]
MAEYVGKKLLGEVEEVGLDEHGSPTEYFGLPPLDRLLQATTDARPQSLKASTAPPVIELMSLAPGGGKTHLLYHLCTIAVLPNKLGGKQACAVIIATDGKFSVSQLAAQLQQLLPDYHTPEATTENTTTAIDEEVLAALRHIHIFRPQSLPSAIATLDSLQTYLFDKTRHYSFDRQVAFIAIDSASTFYWQDRAETEDAAFVASTSTSTTGSKVPALQSAYVQLGTSLRNTTQTFDCPAIVTTWHLNLLPPSSASRGYRPQLPALQPILRLVVRRLPVRKFPPGISLEQALRESGDRQKAVGEAKFECFVNEWGLDERTLQALQRVGGGFGFRVKEDGVRMEGE